MAPLIAHGRFFWECVHKWKVFSNAFHFLFHSGCDDFPLHFCLSFYLSTSSPADHISPLSLSFSLLLSLSGSLREFACTIDISWQHPTSSPGPGQLWGLHLLSRPRGGSIKVRVMQPKPTIQQELSNTRTVRNQVQWRHFFHRDRGRQTNQIWQMWWNNFHLQQVERKSHV